VHSALPVNAEPSGFPIQTITGLPRLTRLVSQLAGPVWIRIAPSGAHVNHTGTAVLWLPSVRTVATYKVRASAMPFTSNNCLLRCSLCFIALQTGCHDTLPFAILRLS
jgi:hypothetical protein